VQSWHSEPSTEPLQNDAPAGGGAHVPTVAPLAIVQVPLQHSALRAQASPVCTQ